MQLTNVAVAPTSTTQTVSVPQVLLALPAQSNLTISATAPVNQMMTLITTLMNHPQATAPHANSS